MTERHSADTTITARFKPAAPASAHLLAAAILWSVVGLALGIRGLLNLDFSAGAGMVWAAGAMVLGGIKGRFILKKTAFRAINRIIERGDGKCLGGFMSARSWLLITAMIIMGKLLRASPLPHNLVWSIYVAVGTALAVSSRFFWQARRNINAGVKNNEDH